MRRALLLAVVALVAAPSSASAAGFSIRFEAHSVLVYGFEECPEAYCDDAVPVEIVLERAGVEVARAGPAIEGLIWTRPAPGDVVHVLRDGVERAAVPFDGMPRIDDTSCAVVGATRLSGTFRHGVPGPHTFSSPGYGLLVDPYTSLRFAYLSDLAEAAISTTGDRWTADFPRPLAPGDLIVVGNAYTAATAAGTARVASTGYAHICPAPPPPIAPPPPPPPVVPPCADAIAADPAFETRLTRAVQRVRLRALRKGVARLTGLPACAGGAVTVEVKAGGAIVARGAATATGAQITQALTRTRRAARLAGRRRARVKVTVRIADGAGGAVTWSCRVTLR